MSVNSLDDLLRQCVLQVVAGEKLLGTAFFVAPGMCLTCAHVIPDGNGSQISLRRTSGNSSNLLPTVIIDKSNSIYPDLALLSVECDEHPYVLFCDDMQLNDQVYCYGYSDKYPFGDSAYFMYEGPSGGNQLLRLKQAQARPGMSGSPLLNQRTGGVCGILEKTRDRETDLGGRGVPSWTILSELEALNLKQISLLEMNNTWINYLTDVQRHIIGVPRKQFNLLVVDGREPAHWKPFGDKTLEWFNINLLSRARMNPYPPPPRKIVTKLKLCSRTKVFSEGLTEVYGIVVDGNALLRERSGNHQAIRQELSTLISQILRASRNIEDYGLSLTVLLNTNKEEEFDYCYEELSTISESVIKGNCPYRIFIVDREEVLEGQFKNELSRFAYKEPFVGVSEE